MIILEGTLDFLIEGEPLITGTVGDVVQARTNGGIAGHRVPPAWPHGLRSPRAIRKDKCNIGSRNRKETRNKICEMSSNQAIARRPDPLFGGAGCRY